MPQQINDCDTCANCPCDLEIHEAVNRVHRWFRLDLNQRLLGIMPKRKRTGNKWGKKIVRVDK